MRFNQRLLDNQELINWCYKPFTDISLITKYSKVSLKAANSTEKEWARSIIGGEGSQWTTLLCQELVKEILIELGRSNVRKTKPKKSTVRNKSYDPDLECDDFVYEVKGRSWSTSGTAGEKILGVPLKYGEIPRLYNKPLKVILVGYQEYEARNGFAFGDLLNPSQQTTELFDTLAYFKDHQIEYVGLTDLLKALGHTYRER